jgi:hypothetical protein
VRCKEKGRHYISHCQIKLDRAQWSVLLGFAGSRQIVLPNTNQRLSQEKKKSTSRYNEMKMTCDQSLSSLEE